jgi:hypothetical protein
MTNIQIMLLMGLFIILGYVYFREGEYNRCFLFFHHKMKHYKGFGYRCKYCGKPKFNCH